MILQVTSRWGRTQSREHSCFCSGLEVESAIRTALNFQHTSGREVLSVDMPLTRNKLGILIGTAESAQFIKDKHNEIMTAIKEAWSNE